MARPNQTTVTRRREATRERLRRAAMEVFAEKGFHGASVEDVCERAGFTRGAFYSNFAALDDLVTELYEQHARRLSARVKTLSAREDLTPEQILAAVLDIWSETPSSEDQWYPLQIEFTLYAIRNKEVGRSWARQQSKVRADLATLVERVATRHRMKLSVTPQEFVRLAQAIYQGGMSQRPLQPQSVRRGSLERRFLQLVLATVTIG
jgi:AcrR family transcriptional regulator